MANIPPKSPNAAHYANFSIMSVAVTISDGAMYKILVFSSTLNSCGIIKITYFGSSEHTFDFFEHLNSFWFIRLCEGSQKIKMSAHSSMWSMQTLFNLKISYSFICMPSANSPLQFSGLNRLKHSLYHFQLHIKFQKIFLFQCLKAFLFCICLCI